MKKQLKNTVKKVITAILICIVAMLCLIAIFNFICIPNNGEKAVKELVRNYDLTTEENSSNTLIVKNKSSKSIDILISSN